MIVQTRSPSSARLDANGAHQQAHCTLEQTRPVSKYLLSAEERVIIDRLSASRVLSVFPSFVSSRSLVSRSAAPGDAFDFASNGATWTVSFLFFRLFSREIPRLTGQSRFSVVRISLCQLDRHKSLSGSDENAKRVRRLARSS